MTGYQKSHWLNSKNQLTQRTKNLHPGHST